MEASKSRTTAGAARAAGGKSVARKSAVAASGGRRRWTEAEAPRGNKGTAMPCAALAVARDDRPGSAGALGWRRARHQAELARCVEEMDQCLSELDAAQRSTGRSTYDEVLGPQDVLRCHAAELDEAIEVLDSEHRVQLALQQRQLLAESEATIREIRHAVGREHVTEMERLRQRHGKMLRRAAEQHKQRLRKVERMCGARGGETAKLEWGERTRARERGVSTTDHQHDEGETYERGRRLRPW